MCRVFHINQWKLVFSSFALLALFNQPRLLFWSAGTLVLCHLQPCSHTLGLNYIQWNSYEEWPWYMQKGKEQAAPYSPLLFLHYIHSLKTCVASLLHINVQVENFQTCKSAFGCAIISVRSQIWHTLSWINPRQVCVHLYTLLYRTVWSTIVQDFISSLRCLKGSINAVVM